MKKISVICMIIIFLSVFFNELIFEFQKLYPIFVVSAVGIIIFSTYFYAKGMQRNISILCFFISAFIIFQNPNFSILYISLEKSVGIISIFIVLPLLTFAIEKGNYSEAIEKYIGKFERESSSIFIILIIFHLILTIILNITSMTIIQKIIDKNNFSKNYLTRLYTAGNSFYMIFSPYDGIVNLVLIMVSVKYYEYFLYALSVGILIILLSVILLKITDKDQNYKKETVKVSKKDKNKIYQLMLNIIILILITVYSSYKFKISNSMLSIAVIILLYSIIWSFQTCNFKEYKTQFKDYIENTAKYGNILIFLISTNCLGELLKYTPISAYVEKGFLKIMFLPEIFIIEILLVLTVILSIAGVHMIIPVTSMAMIIKPEFLNISPPGFVLLLLICWISGMSISPFVPFTAMLSETINEKITSITFKYNKWFVFLILVTAPAVILFLDKILSK